MREFIQPRRIYRLPDVLALVGISRSTLYNRIAIGEFPKPHKIGPRLNGWDSIEVHDWIASQLGECA